MRASRGSWAGPGVLHLALLAVTGAALAGCGAGAPLVPAAPGTPGGSAMSTSGAPPAPSHGAAPADGLDVAAENALPGTPGWRARPSTSPQAPSGYLDHDAVAPGEPVVLRASSRTGAVRVRVYRVGWYGGAGARLVLDRRDVDVLAQPAPTELEPTGAVTAPWRPVATLGTDSTGRLVVK